MTTVEEMNIDVIPEEVMRESEEIVFNVKILLKDYITANFGERCDPCIGDDAPPCGCCEAWKAYDTLFGWEDDE